MSDQPTYVARQAQGGWEVYNTDSQQVVETYTGPSAQTEAEQYAKLLNEVDNAPEWEED